MRSELIKNIRFRLLLLFLLPVSVLLYYVGHNVYEKYQRYERSVDLARTIDSISILSHLIKALQQERGMSVLYLSSPKRKKFAEELRTKQKETDRAVFDLLSFIEQRNGFEKHPCIRNLLKRLRTLPRQRKAVLDRQLDSEKTLRFYNEIAENILRCVREIEPRVADAPLYEKSFDLVRLLNLTELAGQDRAMVAKYLLDHNRSDTELLIRLGILEREFERLEHEYLQQADLEDIGLYYENTDPSLVAKLEEINQKILSGNIEALPDTHAWWQLSTRYIDGLFNAEEKMMSGIQRLKERRKEKTYQTLVVSALLWVLFLFLLSMLFRQISRIIDHFGSRYEQSLAVKKLYGVFGEFVEYQRHDHTEETLVKTLATLLFKTELFPLLWISRCDGNDPLQQRIVLSEGVPLALLKQELSRESTLKTEFCETLERSCRSQSIQKIQSKFTQSTSLPLRITSVEIFPVTVDEKSEMLLLLSVFDESFFTTEILDVLQSIANALGRAIQNRREKCRHERLDQELRIAATAFNAQEAITITDAGGRIIKVNEAFTRITGYLPEEVLGRNPNLLKSGEHSDKFYHEMWEMIRKEGYWKGEIYNRRKNGEIYPEMLSISAVTDTEGNVTNYVAHFADISDIKKAQHDAEYRAVHDALTDLYNRQKLLGELERIYRQSRLNGENNAFLYLDLDNFKYINDYYGHEVGDKVLVEISRRLQTIAYEEDIVARIGGDEFAMILCCLGSKKNSALNKVTLVLQKIEKLFAEPILVDETPLEISFSIGVKFFPDKESQWKDVMIDADVAMYHAKRNGKNRYQFFNAEIDAKSKKFLEIKDAFGQALQNGELCLFYQPKLETTTSKMIGLEALIRWKKPDGRLLTPNEFLFVTEGNTLGYELNEYVLESVMKQIRDWKRLDPDFSLEVSINLSAEQFNRQSYMKNFFGKVSTYPMDLCRHLELEIVEDALLNDLDYTVEIIRKFRRLGIRCSIDDFGTGYSSINYLKHLPVDTLKIDREFVLDLFEGRNDKIIRLIVETAKVFGMTTVAEGVENEKTLCKLAELGCDYYQGYYFSPPVPAETVTREWIEPNRRNNEREIL